MKTKKETNLKENLVYLMESNKVSKKDLANIIGKSRQTVYAILAGSTPGDDVLERLSARFKIDKKDLLYGKQIFDDKHFWELVEKRYQNIDIEERTNPTTEDNKNDENYEKPLDQYLLENFRINAVDFFNRHILPDPDVQEEIASKFGYTSNELFKTTIIELENSFKYKRYTGFTQEEQIDDETFLYMVFSKLSKSNKKLIFNMCQDMLVMQNECEAAK